MPLLLRSKDLLTLTPVWALFFRIPQVRHAFLADLENVYNSEGLALGWYVSALRA